ncbi:chromosome partitioning protein [Pedobacter sp. CG_S7]|uniref:ParA family protein n=1 Tax=Pedobacter sp. CG_S7 TaxID=3143930 RepID=UPI003392D3BF
MATKTRAVAFAGQKGGTGKTTVATATASYIHYTLGKRVLLMDSDSPQYSLWTFRNQELERLANDPENAQRFEKQGVAPYDIIQTTLLDVPKQLEALRASGEYDVIIIDTPGSVNVTGYKECLMSVDCVFTPLEAEEFSLTSNLEFISYLINDILEAKGSKLEEYYVFWNKIRKTTNKDFFIEVHSNLIEEGIKVLDALVDDRVDYQRSICRSTLFPLATKYQTSGLGTLINVVSQKILKN